jgi:hypothetical protein
LGVFDILAYLRGFCWWKGKGGQALRCWRIFVGGGDVDFEESRKVVTSKIASARVFQIHPAVEKTTTRQDSAAMADYKNYLAASILSGDKVVSSCLFEYPGQAINANAGHLPSPQSCSQSPRQCSKRVICSLRQAFSPLLTVKRMLYEFHRLQNGKKPGTVHATYLISGTKRVEEAEVKNSIKKDGEDEFMQSSPFVNSSMPQAEEGTGASSVLTITLTREEDLNRPTSPSSLPPFTDSQQRYAHNTTI